MNIVTRACLAIAAGLFAIQAQAKTAGEVFELVSGSVVVVQALDAKGKAHAFGSGVVLPGGDVATNCHVLENARQYKVKHRGREYPAKPRHSDWDRDVCTLTVSGLKASAVAMGNTRKLKVGARVYAIGAPKGLELTLSEGIVSNLREVGGGQYIQTTAPISPGSSGGGLFDEDGRLVGLPTFFLSEGQQLNFAVPVEWIAELPKRQVETRKRGMTSLEWLNKAIELEKRKDWPALLRHVQRWAQTRPEEAGAWYALGVAYGKAGQIAKAIEAFQQAIRIEPDFAYAWNNLGAAYAISGQTTKAIEAYQQALRIQPENTDAWTNLGIAYAISGQRGKVLEVYRRLKDLDPALADRFFTNIVLP